MSSEKILLVAGEASGEQHASDLVKHLRRIRPETRVYAVGGEKLRQAGAEILLRSSGLSVVGLFEVLNHLGPILGAYKRLTNWMEAHRPSLLVLVDFPEFNLLVARKARALNIPVFYYISPQIWAWRQGRVKRIKKLVNKMAVILPFEKTFYQQHGMDVEFVGHPLLDSVKTCHSREKFLAKYHIPTSERLICLLPGSRTGEIKRHLELFLDTVRLIAARASGVSFCLAMAPGLQEKASCFIEKEAGKFMAEGGPLIRLVKGEAHAAMAASDLAIAASGTVTLEAAILQTPMIVTYRISPMTYWIGRRLVKVKWISLVNLIAGRQIVPEVIQEHANPGELSALALALLEDDAARSRMVDGLKEAVGLLGRPGAAARAASMAASMLAGQSLTRQAPAGVQGR